MKTLKINTTKTTGTFAKILMTVLCVIFSWLTQTISAQSIPCTYNIINNTACELKVDVTFYDSGICHTITGLNILANSSAGVNCATCGTLTDIKIDVVGYSGTPITSFSVDISNQTNTNGGCSGMNMDWFPTYTVIYP